MRLFRVLSVLSLLLGALASPAPEPAAHRLDVRDSGTSSLCGDVNSDAFGLVDTCLCQVTLPNIIANNAILSGLAAIFGEEAVVEELAGLILNAAGSKPCTYPANSIPTCTVGTTCGFTCINGFTLTSDNTGCECGSEEDQGLQCTIKGQTYCYPSGSSCPT